MCIALSIVIPVKDEAKNVEPLAREINRVMDTLDCDWECIWVDDGSRDGSHQRLRKLVEQNSRHHCLRLQKTAGQSAALWIGFEHARGKVIATLDGDGQNDPQDLPPLYSCLMADRGDMIHGYRRQRQDSVYRKVVSWVANGCRNLITGRTVRDAGCSTRVFKRVCIANLPLFEGMHRFLSTLVAMQGYRIEEIPVNHRPRRFGKTKYTIGNRIWVGVYDLFGIMWLRRRRIRFPTISGLDEDGS